MKLRNIFLVVWFLSGCEEDSAIKSSHNEYLPLQVGNIWKFSHTGSAQNVDYTFKKVTGIAHKNGNQYYVVASGYADPHEVTDYVTYFRITPQGYVYTWAKDATQEENRFRLNSEYGDNWSYKNGENEDVYIELSEVSVTLESSNLEHCKLYSYDVAQWADEEYETTFAKGIGFVKEYSTAWGIGSELQSAVIGGKKFDF